MGTEAAAAGQKLTRARAGAPRWEVRGDLHGEQQRGLARSGGGGMGAARCTERPRLTFAVSNARRWGVGGIPARAAQRSSHREGDLRRRGLRREQVQSSRV